MSRFEPAVPIDPRVASLVTGVRRRWRLARVLRGLVWATAITAAVALVAAVTLERLRFDPDAVGWLRAVTWLTLVGSFAYFVLRPLLRPVTAAQVALYLEEHEPSLEHALVSALDAGALDGGSTSLHAQIVEAALDRAARVEEGRRVERGALQRFGGALTAMVVTLLAGALLGPAPLRHGLGALLVPTRSPSEVSPYAVGVEPGDVTISRGADQVVRALPRGFDPDEASVFVRTQGQGDFRRLSMLRADGEGFELMLFALTEATEYFVEAAGVRSPSYRIEVADLPYVAGLELTYHFPAYTGLEPRTVEGGGDVAALRGTVVELLIETTLSTPGGRLLVDGEPAGEVVLAGDGRLAARFTVDRPGFYAIELAREDGSLVSASPEYTIDLLEDQPPTVRFTRPGRDAPASPIEEVYLEVGAEDDFGVGDLRLVYSVNGGPEDTVQVFRNSGAPLPEVSAGHTLFLEEWALEPGDLVSYYAIVRDNRSLGTNRVVSSDIYFLNIRPFERAYREAEQGGGMGGGAQGGTDTALSELQRQVIAATFNLIRQQESYETGEFSENVTSVALAQGRLRGQVETLLQRIQNRGLTQSDPGFRDVSEILPLATEAMRRAEADLSAEALREALPDEQEALRYLQQAEETYERYVQQGQPQGGGAGGGQSAAAEDLADLFELELDKLQNQYETVRRGAQESADAEVDELLEELRELARRQEQEAERERRRTAQRGSQGGSAQGGASQGGASQRDLAERTEEAARQLQRLSRERGDPGLEETARRLQEAAASMRQSASQGGNAGSSEASEALRRLEEVRRQLEDDRAARAGRDADEALRQLDELQRQQREVQRDVRALAGQDGSERGEAIDRLRERKNQMNEAVRGLERELDRAATSGRSESPDAARRLLDAANAIRETKLKEKIQYSRGTIEQWDPETALTLELTIESDLQTVREAVEEARASAATGRTRNPLEEALEEARSLVRGMEAMERRLGEPEAGPLPRRENEAQAGRSPGDPSATDPSGRPNDEGSPDAGAAAPSGDGGRNATAGGPARGTPRPLSPEEIRQYRNEIGMRSDRLQDLRRQLAEAGHPVGDLESVLDAMERLEGSAPYQNPTQVAALQAQVLEGLKRLEFGLRRVVEGTPVGRGTLSGSGEVPEAYRSLVEEYYRSLAREGGGAPR